AIRRYIKFIADFMVDIIDTESIPAIFSPTNRKKRIDYPEEINNSMFRSQIDNQFENIIISIKNQSYASKDPGPFIFTDINIRKEQELFQAILYLLVTLAQQNEKQLKSSEPF